MHAFAKRVLKGFIGMFDLIMTGLVAYGLFALGAWMKEKGVLWASVIASILCAVFAIRFAFGLFGFVLGIVGGIIGILVSVLVLAIVFAVPVIVVLLVAKAINNRM